jgi:Na+-transporting methylmalonyl-CoA/oxaloacetate decarboxylase gamma subunit
MNNMTNKTANNITLVLVLGVAITLIIHGTTPILIPVLLLAAFIQIFANIVSQFWNAISRLWN